LLVENYVQSPRLCVTTFLNCWSRNGHTKQNTTQPKTQTAHITTQVTTRGRTEFALGVRSARMSRSLHVPVAGGCSCPRTAFPAPLAATTQTYRRRRRRRSAGARHVIHHTVYRCSKHIDSVPALATSFTGARHVRHHVVYQCNAS